MSSTGSLSRVPAIDGMRGLGVMIVLLYHAGVSVLAGAFVNMDLFFVTSGLLITTLLLRARDRQGSVPLRAFWIGRARRLLPALFAVVGLVGVYGYVLADTSTLTALRSDMLSALGFFSNWHFINDSASYFTEQSLTSPLLHTWSLAIEEQFYLVWPILLALWFRLRHNTRGLLPVIAALTLASVVYMAVIHVPGSDPSKVYFNTFARGQSLLIGCFLAVWLHRRRHRGATDIPVWTGPVGLLALVVILALPFVVDTTTEWIFYGGFLGVSTLAALLGASLILNPFSLVSRLLTVQPLPWLGKIIYGLYIWHWPLFIILDQERTGLDGIPLIIVRIAVTVVVAWAFDRLVERRIQAGVLRNKLSFGPRWAILTSSLAAVLTWTFVSTAAATTPLFGTALPGAVSTMPGPMRPDQRRVVLVGDSVAYSLWKGFPSAQEPDLSIGHSIQFGCGVQFPLRFVGKDGLSLDATQCTDYAPRWEALFDVVQPDVVILVSGSAELYDLEVDGRPVRSGTPEYDQLLTAAYERALDVAGAHGARPVLLANIPCYDRQDQLTVEFAQAIGVAPDQIADVNQTQNDPDRQARLNKIVSTAATNSKGVSMLDMKGFLCPDGTYQESQGGVRMRVDGVHFTPQGAALWWQQFAPQIRSVMLPATPREPRAPIT